MRRTHLVVLFLAGIFLSAFVLPFSSYSVVTFEETYGGFYDDWGYCVQQTLDGGYIIVGTTEPYGHGWQDIYLVKTDSFGGTMWTSIYGLTAWDFGYSVQQTSDGGYIIGGYEGPVGPDKSDIYAIKTDSLGGVAWSRTYDFALGRDYSRSIRQTSDGGYIIAGTVQQGLSQLYLAKIDYNGEPVWTKTYGGSAGESGRSVRQTWDGGYIVTGHTSSFGSGSEDVYLIKTDPSGDSVWTRTYGGVYGDYGESVQQTSDGGYIIAGYSWSFGIDDPDVYVVKTDSLGDTVWTGV